METKASRCGGLGQLAGGVAVLGRPRTSAAEVRWSRAETRLASSRRGSFTATEHEPLGLAAAEVCCHSPGVLVEEWGGR